jgi:hypothetical protein
VKLNHGFILERHSSFVERQTREATMALAGEGAVAIWHDIAPEGRAAFYAWHGEEHMPERVGIPGFLRGRRYVAVDADLEFFNLYEALSPQVLTGSDYQSRLNAPTPWTRETVRHFRRVARSICRVAASFGRGHGGLAATWRYDVPEDEAESHLARLRDEVLPGIARRPDVAGAHLLVADADASAVKTEEQKVRTEANVIPRWVLILESWGDEASFPALCDALLPDGLLHGAGARGDLGRGLYRLQNWRCKTDWTA